MSKQIRSALISVFSKEGLRPIAEKLHQLNVTIYSTGGTQKKLEEWGIPVVSVESVTTYPSILDGRVKTLHPKVFGGILARREDNHLAQLDQYKIPEVDCVIVDLYPFEETVANSQNESEIIEKIDIGGISLIRAAAKNYKDVVVVPSKEEYESFLNILNENNGVTSLEERHHFARRSFAVSSHYDSAIFNYFNKKNTESHFRKSVQPAQELRYGENPHQRGFFYGNLNDMFEVLGGKALSYNNLVDVDAAVNLMREFVGSDPTFAVLKHTNPCGVATRPTVLEAWEAALAGDPVSAFGGILICNHKIDLATAEAIDKIFYEVLIAPEYEEAVTTFLLKKKNRRILKIKEFYIHKKSFKSLLNGVVEMETDLAMESEEQMEPMTEKQVTAEQKNDLIFALKCVKHLKSNTITLVKNQQLLGMGCGQTSRVDALRQAIHKAKHFKFELGGAVMASDAFFPFPDCVEIANEAGIVAVVQPGGSKNDQLSVDFCNENGLAMMKTGVRHFKH